MKRTILVGFEILGGIRWFMIDGGNGGGESV
jgi:hypothetical protein